MADVLVAEQADLPMCNTDDDSDDDPEAIFDFITMRSMQARYGNIESPRLPNGGHISGHDSLPKNEAIYANETDFETFVQQFPIDDSIAECFATSNDVGKKTSSRFISGGKRPQLYTKYSKLKKKFGRKQSDDISLLSDEEIRSRDKKRSKKSGGVFSKRQKWRNGTNSGSKKSVNFSDHSEKSESDIVDDVFEDSLNRHVVNSGEATHWGSFSASDSQITSFSETLTRLRNEASQELPPPSVHIPSGTSGKSSKSLDPTSRCLDASNVSSAIANNGAGDEITEILTGTTGEMVSRIEDVQPERALKIRDHHDNTLLHRCVLLGNHDVIKYILEKFPEMTSDINCDNETAVEMAAKMGRYECLKVMVDRSQRRQFLGTAMLNRLLNVCAQNGQAECMALLLHTMSREPHATCTLPGDSRGNTAAHLAAKHGHLQCLHTLVSSGYDVTSENLLQQRPLHVAHQSRSHHCFEYLLLLDVCRELFSSLRAQTRLNAKLSDQQSGSRSSINHVRQCLHRYEDLCKDTNESLQECKESILDTVRTIQADLELCFSHTAAGNGASLGVEDKIRELNAEIERLEDTFDFSPFAEMDEVLSKLFTTLDDAESKSGDSPAPIDPSHIPSTEEESKLLGSLIKGVHREYILENWNTRTLLNTHISASNASPLLRRSTKDTDASAVQDTSDNKQIQQIGLDSTDRHTTKASPRDQATSGSSGNANSVNNNSNDYEEQPKPVSETDAGTKKPSSSTVYSDIKSSKSSPPREQKDESISRLNAMLARSSPKQPQTSHSESFSSNGSREDSDKENEETVEDIENPTERPFTKLLTLDERIDLLIAGERKKEKAEDGEDRTASVDSRDSYCEQPSLYTSTFTSITSDASSSTDWYNRLGLASSTSTDSVPHHDVSYDVTTSGSASYWWDAGDKQFDPREFRVPVPHGSGDRGRVHLNLANEDSSYDELRQERLVNHLKAVQQSRISSDTYRERITTASGEIIGGFQHSHDRESSPPPRPPTRRVLVDVNGALRNRTHGKPVPKPRKRAKPKLFTLEDAIETQPISDVPAHYPRSRDRDRHMKWEESSMSEDEELSLAWSEYGTYGMIGDRSELSDSLHTTQSFV